MDVLPPAQQAIWPELRPAPGLGYCLYGGTAIALRLGHRFSIDFDFFSARPLPDVQGYGCLRPWINSLKVSGTLNALPVEKLPLADTVTALTTDDSNRDAGQEISEDIAAGIGEVSETIADLGVLPNIPLVLPGVHYNIEARYRNLLGNLVSISVPGVFGVATPVVVGNYYSGGAETIEVTLTSGLVNGAKSGEQPGYSLVIERKGLLPSTCKRLDADVKIVLQLQKIGSLQPSGRLELGYDTISYGTSSVGAPAKFVLETQQGAADDFSVHLDQTPSCGASGPLDLVGRFEDSSDRTDLSMAIKMPVATDFRLARMTDDDGKQMIGYRSDLPISEVSLTGTKSGNPSTLRLTNVPVAVNVCNHDGNLCNAAWRAGRDSRTSASFAARDATGRPAPLSILLAGKKTTVEGDGAVVENNTDVSLTLSDLAYDLKFGRIGYEDVFLPFLKGGEYPYFFYLDTQGQPMSGYLRSNKLKDGQEIKKVNITTPAPGTYGWDREIVLKKKWYGLRLYRYGYLGCSAGFGIDLKNLPPAGDSLVKFLLCS